MYQKSVLDNGIRVISERLPSCTVSVGIWIDVGSRDEHGATNGCAHFIEHMLFKGTRSRSAQQIARELDMLGGLSNAFTSTENTCFFATVLAKDLPKLVELLSDLLLNSLIDPEEIARERQVILQEISAVEDTPDDQIHELFSGMIWADHPLGNTVLGDREVVATMDRTTLTTYLDTFYTPDRFLITAAGNVDHQSFSDLCAAAFADLSRPPQPEIPARSVPPQIAPVRRILTKPLEQVHLITGTYGLSITAAERYSLLLMNIILGGNMSSRLFQEIREKRGLAYSIYSYLVSYQDSGYIGIYLGMDRHSANEALQLIIRELELLAGEPMAGEDLANAKDYAKGGMYLTAENMESRMTWMARNELYFNRYIGLDETAAEIDRVTPDDIQYLAGRLFGDRGLSATVIGPLTEKDIDFTLLK